MGADMAELVHQCSATYDSIIVYSHFTGKLHSIGHDYIVTHHAVMSHMAIGHNQTVLTHYGLSFGRCASVDSNALAYHGIVAYDGCCLLSTEFEILRDTRNDSSRKYRDILAYTGTFKDGNIAAYTCALAYLNIFIDGDKRLDDDTVSYLGIGMHVG